MLPKDYYSIILYCCLRHSGDIGHNSNFVNWPIYIFCFNWVSNTDISSLIVRLFSESKLRKISTYPTSHKKRNYLIISQNLDTIELDSNQYRVFLMKGYCDTTIQYNFLFIYIINRYPINISTCIYFKIIYIILLFQCLSSSHSPLLGGI